MKSFLNFYLIILPAFMPFRLDGQTDLYPGDLAILGIQTDNPDNFSFTFLVNVEQNSVIFFTDCGLKSDGNFREGEGVIKYTAPSNLPAGTIVTYIRDSACFTAANDIIPGSRGFNLSTSGDQIIAFQETSDKPRFVYAIQTNSSRWQKECNNSNVSCLPPGLEDGFTAICVGKDTAWNSIWRNAACNLDTQELTGKELMQQTGNRSNWTFSNKPIPLPSENLKILPPANRSLKLNLPPGTVFYSGDTLHLGIEAAGIDRLNIIFRDLNKSDSALICKAWNVKENIFNWAIPRDYNCDSFRIRMCDAAYGDFWLESPVYLIMDTISPVIVSCRPVTPENYDSIMITFSETVMMNKGFILLRNISSLSDTLIMEIPDENIKVYDTVVLLGLPGLLPGETYKLEIPAGTFIDTRGNPFRGTPCQKDIFVTMKFAKPEDHEAPVILNIEPDLNQPVDPDSDLTIFFSEPIFSAEGTILDPETLYSLIILQDSAGITDYDFDASIDNSLHIITLTPYGLESGSTYCCYIISLTDSAGNEASGLQFIFRTAEAQEAREQNFNHETFRVYPNPSGQVIHITTMKKGKVELKLADMNGQVLRTAKMDVFNESIAMDISDLPAGIYILYITVSGQTSQRLIVKW